MHLRILIGTSVVALVVTFANSAAFGSSQQQKDELPEGDGKRILLASCTGCHELTEVTKFRGYYTRDEWHDIVRTMIEYGAKVQDKEVDVLVDYLAKNFGKATEERR